jgi:hypothetical protein
MFCLFLYGAKKEILVPSGEILKFVLSGLRKKSLTGISFVGFILKVFCSCSLTLRTNKIKKTAWERFSEYFRNKKDYLLEAVAFFDFLSFVAFASVVDALALLPSEQWLFISADDVDLLQHAFPSAFAQPCFASVDGFSDVAVTEVDAF